METLHASLGVGELARGKVDEHAEHEDDERHEPAVETHLDADHEHGQSIVDN